MDSTQTTFPEGLEELGFGKAFKQEICSMLEKIQMIQDFSRQEIELLATFVRAYHAPAGTTLFQEGKRDSFLCLVVDGEIDVLKEAGYKNRRKIATIRAGKSIGEMSIIDGQPHSATVITTTEATLLLLTKNKLFQINETHPRLGLRIIWKIAELMSLRLRQTSGILVDYL